MKNEKKTWLSLALGTPIFLSFLSLGYACFAYPTIFNSNFVTALAGAAAGSGMILFIEWYRRQDELLGDINLSIAVLSTLLSSMLGIKKQHVLPTRKKYLENLALVEAAKRAQSSLPENLVVRIAADFTTHMSPSLEADIPLERLRALVSHLPRVVGTVMQVRYFLAYFNQAHTKLMDFHLRFQTMPRKETIELCFLFKRDQFTSDTSYRDIIEALALHADDVLWFADASIKEITDAGKKALPWWLRGRIVKYQIFDEHMYLMPPSDHVKLTEST